MARAARQQIGIVAPLQRVIAIAAIKQVRPDAAEHKIIPRLTRDQIIAVVAIKRIRINPDATAQSVIAQPAIDQIRAAARQDPVVSGKPVQRVIARIALNDIIAPRASN